MTDLEERVHRALHYQVQHALSQPDPADLRARVSRAKTRRQRRRIATASFAVVVAATAATLALRQSGSNPSATTVGPVSTSATANAGACPFMHFLPFKLTYLPGGAPLPAQPLVLTSRNFASWAFPGGIIEISRGADLPPVHEPIQSIVVLGQPGRIGAISDGYSVVFNLGNSNDPCQQWALNTHPPTTLEQTRAIAEALLPA